MKDADKIKIALMFYWRFKRQCPIVAIEHSWGNIDVLAVTQGRRVIDTEVKISIGDLNRDSEKPKHRVMRGGSQAPWFGETYTLEPFAHYFYFAVPAAMADQALIQVRFHYPYAGLLQVDMAGFEAWENRYDPPRVECVKRATLFKKKSVSESQILDLCRSVSKTACWMGYHLIKKESDGQTTT